MRKRSISKIITIFITLILVLLAISPVSSASDDIWGKANNFIKPSNKIDTAQVRENLMPIARTLVTIANFVLPIVLIILAVKYMMADSPDKRAKIKTQLIGLALATIVIYGAQIIWSIMYNVMNNATS